MDVDPPVLPRSAPLAAPAGGARRAAWWLGLAGVWILGSLYGGALPHRDCIELYTGGFTYLNALAFEAFGIHLPAGPPSNRRSSGSSNRDFPGPDRSARASSPSGGPRHKRVALNPAA